MNGLCQETRRLYSRGAGCRGLAIDDHGAMFGSSVELVQRTWTGFRALAADELEKRFIGLSEVQADPGLVARRLSRIANALESGALLRAQLLGLQLPFAKAEAWETENRNAAGEWATSGSVGGGMLASTLRSLGLDALEASEIEIGVGLGISAASASAAGFVAGMVYPSGNWLTYQGTLPGHPDIDFRYAEGDLSLYRTGADGKPALFYQAIPDQDGFYRDADGTIVGRNLGHDFQIDADRIAAAPAGNAEARSQARAAEATDEPKLCPAPSPDYPHGASLRAIYYQWQITGLPPGLAVEFNGHVYDGCDPVTGHPLEAKGEGMARILRFTGDKLLQQWANKAAEDAKFAGGELSNGTSRKRKPRMQPARHSRPQN